MSMGRSACTSSQLVFQSEKFLTLILLRVPWKQLVSLKCVSRQWYSLITAPHFISLRNLSPLDDPNTPSPQLKSSSSSQDIVLNDEDLLTSILLRVPWTKLKVLKCVSRQWQSLITSPHFRSLLPPLRASGLFIQHNWLDRIHGEVYFIPLDNRNTPSTINTFFPFAEDPDDIQILLSCNGLLLCYTSSGISSKGRNCYVYSPSTNYYVTLPELPDVRGRVLPVGLIFYPSKSLHYKVIAFVFTSESSYVGDFHIYSSETRTWKASIKSFTPGPGLIFRDGVYWNGCIHWFNKLNTDPEAVHDCVYFNIDEERLGTFPRPPISVTSTMERSLYFGKSEDHLHFVEVCHYASSSLRVYEMKSDYSEWFVKYQINLGPISEAFPEMIEHKSSSDKNYYSVVVLSLIRRENFNEDSFLVLEIPGKAIHYNLVDTSFKVLSDYVVDLQIDYFPPRRCAARQYIQSLPGA